jgi:hypothetical protein
VKNLTLENINQVNKEFLHRKQGLTIRDKIEEHLDKFSSSDFRNSEINNRYNTLDMPYSTDFLGDMKIFYKINKKFATRVEEFVEYGDPLEENKIVLESESDRSLINPKINYSLKNIKNDMRNTKSSLEYIDVEEEEEEESTQNSIIIY